MDSIYQSIEILSKEKGIDSQIVLDAVKDAMLIAARKHFRSTENYEAVFDENSGGIRLYALKTVAEFHELRWLGSGDATNRGLAVELEEVGDADARR